MTPSNLATLGAVVLAGAAIGWLTVGERTPSGSAPFAPEAIAEENAAVAGGAQAVWATPRAPSPRSAASDGGPDQGLPPPPPSIDVAADAMRRAQQFSPATPSAAPQAAAGEVRPSPTAPAPVARPATPQGAGWTPTPDSGWAPPADPRQAGWGTPTR